MALVSFGLQGRFPITRAARLKHHATSFAWYLIFAVGAVTWLGAFSKARYWAFRGPLSFLTVDLDRSWPASVRFAAWFVVIDALGWWGHRLRHSVPWLWRFHQLHHSADQMSFWAAQRTHPVDAIVAGTILAIPVLVLGASPVVIGSVVLAQKIQGHVVHSNFRLSFGRVDALIVTPQWHRLHHSTSPDHYNRNFGGTFTLWDRLFGTAVVPGRYDFPAIGLAPAMFPADADRLRDLPRTVARQFLSPFRRADLSGAKSNVPERMLP